MTTPTFLKAAAVACLVSGPPANASPTRVYRIVPAESTVAIHVGKAGLLKGFGHEHEVVARRVSGQIELAPGDPRAGRVSLLVESASLEVQAAGEPPGDVPKVQATMLGPQVLDVEHHPRIRFTSTSVTVSQLGDGVLDVRVVGELELRGVARSITVRARVGFAHDQIRAQGTTTIRQTAFGIEPVRAAAGSVRVKDEIEIRFSLVAR